MFITIDEACEILHFKKSYVYRLAHERAIPFYKPRNGRILFDRTELETLIKAGRVSTQQELSEKAEAILNRKAV